MTPVASRAVRVLEQACWFSYPETPVPQWPYEPDHHLRYICGDGISDSSMGLNAARVAIVANLQASKAIEILIGME